MKSDIHPEYVETQVTCTCGNYVHHPQHEPRTATSTSTICSACHPFYTGKQRILDTGGRVARFEARYGKRTPTKK